MIRRAWWVVLTVMLVPALAAPARAEEPAEDGMSLLRDQSNARRISLLEAVRMGLQANLSLKAGSVDPVMAFESWRAASAIFDPLVTAELEYSHNETPVTSAFFGKPVITDQAWHGAAGVQQQLRTGGRVSLLYASDRLDTDSLFVNLNPAWTQGLVLEGAQPLLRGAGDVVMTDIRKTSNGVRIARESYQAQVESILLQVVAAYWELVYAQEQVVSRVSSEDVARELLRTAEARLAQKVGTPLDVAEARAGLERRRGTRIQAEGQRGTRQDLLRALVLPFGAGQASGVTFLADGKAAEVKAMQPDPRQLDRYVTLALANRHDLRATQADISNRSLDVYAAANAVRPQLDVVGRLGSTGLTGSFGSSLEDMVTGEAVSAALGLQFSMFIGQRAARAHLRLAEWARRQAVIDQKELENQIVVQIRAALRDVLVAKASLEAAREEEKAAGADVKGEQQLLKNGKSTPFNVLLKEDVLSDARRRISRADADRRIALASFWRSMGFLTQSLGVEGQSPRCGRGGGTTAPPLPSSR